MEKIETTWKKGDIVYGVGISGLIKVYEVQKVTPCLVPKYVVLELNGLLIKEKTHILIEDTKVFGDMYEGSYYANTTEKVYTFWDTVFKDFNNNISI